MNEKFGFYGTQRIIETMKNQINTVRAELELADISRKASLRAEKLAQSVLKNAGLTAQEKLEILEFVFLTNK